MAQIAIGYGEYSGYLLTEVPDDFLSLLGQRYPLNAANYDASDGETLVITVGVHGELARRASGGQINKHIPTVPQFAKDIVKQGFWQLSKIHHPDQRGHNDAQRRLTEARDCLNRLCDNIDDDPLENAVWIPEPPESRERMARPVPAQGVSDDDIPF